MRNSARRSMLLSLLLAVRCLGSGCILPSLEPQSSPIPSEDPLTIFGTSPLTLDPAISQDSGSHTYIVQMFRGLVTLDENMDVVPDIAEGGTIETTDEGTVYTFHLRSGVKFHDGREVTSADFKYSLERACQPETGSPTAATYLNDTVGVAGVLSGPAGAIAG